MSDQLVTNRNVERGHRDVQIGCEISSHKTLAFNIIFDVGNLMNLLS